MTSTIITHEIFSQMMAYQPLAENRASQRTIKQKLLKPIFQFYGERFHRFKKQTKEMLDFIAWIASEKGFFFCSQEYLGDRHDISERTVRARMKELIDAGEVVAVYRRNPKGNSRGKPIYLFKRHTYFAHWKELLGIKDCQEDCQEEIASEPREAKDSEQKSNATLYLTFKNNKYNKRKEYELDYKFTPKCVPDEFVQTVKPFFNSAKQIYRLWGKVRLAYARSQLNVPLEETVVLNTAINAFEQSVAAYKLKHIKKAFTGYFFGTLRNTFTVLKREEVRSSSRDKSVIFYDWLNS